MTQTLNPIDRIAARRFEWQQTQARQNQLPPENTTWNTYLALAGRGFGKTRLAAEWLAWQAIKTPNSRWAVVAPTFGDVRDTAVEGPSGLVNILNDYGVLATYNRSIGELILTNKSRIKMFSGEEPDRLRGPNFHGGWFDELAAFSKPDAWDQYKFALRLGQHPQTVITTTPRPTKIIKDLLNASSTLTVRGSTFDNAANLAPTALAELRLKYEGTRLGRQELYGEITDEVEGALFNAANLDRDRVGVESLPPLVRIVVGVDPAVTSGENADETGIVVAGITTDGHYYVLDDLTCRKSPDAWARVAVDAYHKHSADRIVAETNNGGDMIEVLVRQVDASVAYKKVTATRGKIVRAEPVASLSEQGRLHMVGSFVELEDQLCNFTVDSRVSPNNFDAMVWAVTELMGNQTSMMGLMALAQFCSRCRMPAGKLVRVCPSCGEVLGDKVGLDLSLLEIG